MSWLQHRPDLKQTTRQESFKIESSRASEKKGQRLVQESFPKYNLKWPALKAWLEDQFPDLHFGDAEV